MTPMFRFIACLAAGILWLASIVAKHFWPDIDVALFQNTCAAIVAALGIHGMISPGQPSSIVQMPAVPASKSTEGGFALVRLLGVIAAIAFGLAMLGGCTTTTASMYRGYTADAVAGVKMWDDNTLATVQTVLCAQPYSAIQRHPELQPGVQALCGPLANTASLDANQLALLMGILQSSGVKLQAAPMSVTK